MNGMIGPWLYSGIAQAFTREAMPLQNTSPAAARVSPNSTLPGVIHRPKRPGTGRLKSETETNTNLATVAAGYRCANYQNQGGTVPGEGFPCKRKLPRRL